MGISTENEKPLAMAPEITHQEVFQLVKKYLPESSRVIDLGAGEGAFTKRLLEIGHQVTALDGASEQWKLENVDFRIADLDKNFAEEKFTDEEKFDAIIAIEIIEHLENPFNFIRQCAKLLKKDGLIFLTTPNVEALNSRLLFLYRGRLKNFTEWETVRPAHITPIFRWKLDLIFAEAGIEYLYHGFCGTDYDLGFTLKARLGALAVKMMNPFIRGEKGKESRIVVGKKV